MKTKALIIFAGCTTLMACGGQQQAQTETYYAAITMSPSDEMLSSAYSASIRGKSDIAVMPQVSGYITKVCVEEGQRVRKGQQLFIIDQVPYIAAHETAQANVSVAEANVNTASITYNSKKELFAQEVISEYELKMTENALASAEAQLKLAKAQETNASNNLSYTVVKSPSDGVVGTLPYKVGALVGPSIPAPLTTVSDNTEMYVYFSMTENQLLSLMREYESVDAAIGSIPPVKLQLSDGSMFSEEGRIETISGVIDPVTGAVSFKASFPNKGGLLHSGGAGKVIIPQPMENIFMVPKSATFEIQDKTFVYKVIDGIAKATMVDVGTVSTAENYIVQGGLSVGDVIIAEGVGFLRDGTPVNVK